MINAGGVSLNQNVAITRSGKPYISLQLIDMTKKRIQGAIILNAIPYTDATTNMQSFHFVEAGGNLDFIYDDARNGMFLKILDCEHNRKFLASHFKCGFWEIENEKIKIEIEELSKELAKEAVKFKETVKDVAKETMLSDEQLEIEMARLQGEASRRKLGVKADLGPKVKPEEVTP